MLFRRLALAAAVALAGCAQLEFHQGWVPAGGLHYYDPKPYLLVTQNKDCTIVGTVIVLPGVQQTISFHPGYGTENLTASLKDGMISSVGQQTDTKIPETITAVTGLAGALKPFAAAEKATAACSAEATLFEIDNGVVQANKPVRLAIQ